MGCQSFPSPGDLSEPEESLQEESLPSEPPGILTTGLCYNKFDVVPPLDLASKVIP